MASLVAVDITKSAGIRSVTFNEYDLITTLANDYGYENWIAKAIEFYHNSNDLVVLISASGQSLNVINAVMKSVQNSERMDMDEVIRNDAEMFSQLAVESLLENED